MISDQETSGALHGIKDHYRAGKSDLGSDFFGPCLSRCTLYRRAVGYFASSALVTWADALQRLSSDRIVRIHLIASPYLQKNDIEALSSTLEPEQINGLRQQIIDRLISEIIDATYGRKEHRRACAQLFAWLVANNQLTIKFAFADHVEEPGPFHEKIGIFDFPGGEQIAFTGSANETLGGYSRNYESIDVYRSWIEADKGRVATKAEQFEESWANEADGLGVYDLSKTLLERLCEVAPSERPVTTPPPSPPAPVQPPQEDERWKHQSEAIDTFLEERAGILEMATGTGKTRTALKILSRLSESGAIDSAIVTTDGTDLLSQWCGEVEFTVATWKNPYIVHRHFGDYHEGGEYVLDPAESILVVSRGQLGKLIKRIPRDRRKKMIIVHDEVHGLGTPSLMTALDGEHPSFEYRLGLSATPERAYDDEGNKFIENELGPTIFRFPLEAAIARGVLCEFDYRALESELTEGDKQRIQQVYARKAAREKQGNPMSKEELWIEISKVYKTAEMKPDVFYDYLKKDPTILERSIIFVETKEYGGRLLDNIHGHSHLYRTYYAEDDQEYLVDFANNNIDCLITCHRVSQGIDIQSLRHVILFASARSKLETIQRIGRCLRSDPEDPDKRACVIDFVRPAGEDDPIPNADQERREWLEILSRVRKGDEIAT